MDFSKTLIKHYVLYNCG